MPLAVERDLERVADRKGLTGERRNAFVYGTMLHKLGWKPAREAKGNPHAEAIRRRLKK